MNPRIFFEDGPGGRAPVLAEDFLYPDESDSAAEDQINSRDCALTILKKIHGLYATGDPRITKAAMDFHLGLEGRSMAAVARELRCTKAAISNRLCKIADALGLPTFRSATIKKNYRVRQARLWRSEAYRQKRRATRQGRPSNQTPIQKSESVNTEAVNE